MGSKRKIAPKIMDYICAQNPNAKYFYDLFGGGGATSFEALQRPQFKKVIYNELNTGVVELLKKIRAEGVTDDFYQWVSREKFEAHKNDSDWFGGLCKTCWSFGNNQKSYLFGKDVEPIKKAAHDYLMANGYDKATDTRVRLVKEFKAIEAINGRFQLQQLEQLERLEQLEQLEQLERLEIKNNSYADVVVDTPIEETVIYLDPPYEGTAKYALSIDHRDFDEWVKASPYKIYISSYESIFPCVFGLNHNSRLRGKSAKSNKKTVERLFCNKPENNFFNLF
jgi:site-specific DNA-adenine methylase